VKRFLPGLRTEILLSLTVLLVTAMLLTSFVVSRIWERDLLRYKAADGKALIQKIQAVVDTLSADGAVPLDVIKTQLEQFAAENVPAEIFDPLVIQAKDGALWAGDRESRQTFGVRDFMFSKALDMKKGAFHVGREKNLLLVSAPVFVKDRPIAVVQAPVRIDGVLQGLRRSEHLIWFYIGLNVLVLIVFGTFLLSRIVIRPMKRLVKTAEDFENTNGPYSFRKPTEHNEIGRLAMSLNSMLKRLAENRHEMETQIQSLEKANMELKEARDEVLRSEKLSCLDVFPPGSPMKWVIPWGLSWDIRAFLWPM
jgi:two-component system, NtrC family, sensor kinase